MKVNLMESSRYRPTQRKEKQQHKKRTHIHQHAPAAGCGASQRRHDTCHHQNHQQQGYAALHVWGDAHAYQQEDAGLLDAAAHLGVGHVLVEHHAVHHARVAELAAGDLFACVWGCMYM